MKSKIVMLVILALAVLPLAAQKTTTPAAPATPDTVSIAKDLVMALKAGDYAKGEANFSPALAKRLPQAKLKTLWEMETKQYGAVTEIKSATASKLGSEDLVTVKCTSTKGDLDVVVGFDKQQHISAFNVRPSMKK